MSCRLAGDIESPAELWRFLVAGRSAVSEVPEQRWAAYAAASPENAAALRKATRFGSYMSDITGFDAGFFGISPREAELMDPQQRMALELAWEALEHAGIAPDSLAGSDTGVFVGVGADDYGRRLLEDLPSIEARTGIGGAYCAVPNRVSYTLDLRGSSFAVDTACSSSLVAMHTACQSLRLGEIPLAIAGGVMIMAGPGLTLVLDAAGATSKDGRSKSFDAAADGYGRGEGCGMVVLKRLSDAQRDGDRVLALIRGSAVHQDGKTNGIMAPSEEAQAHLLRRVYQASGIPPATIDYVEAHGTGTKLGDPQEVRALATVVGAGRSADEPCLIGSVKTNVGHLEAGAGVVGVIKAVLALGAAQLPPSLNFTTPNPEIPWDTAGLEVVTELRPWPEHDHPRRAGVSGYGYGGTIAHVILEQAPDEDSAIHNGHSHTSDRSDADFAAGRTVYPLSAGSAAGLAAYAGKLADWLTDEGREVPVADVGHTLAHRRSHLAYRAGVVAAGRAELVDRLRALAAGEPAEGVQTSAVARDAGAVWVFSGHGSQWIGMGRELLADDPMLGKVLDQIEPIFLEEIGFSPRQALMDGDFESVERIQPLIFAMQVGLAEVWRSYGVTPAAVLGHSVGEIAAAVVAGVFDLADGARLICRRSKLLRQVAGQGAMAMVGLPFEEVTRGLADRTDVVAAISASPVSSVVSGETTAIEQLVEQWGQEGLYVRKVASDVAFHSGQMDPLLGELVSSVADLVPAEPKIPVYSTALADPRSDAARDGHYWAMNLREPVRFADAITAAGQDGHRVFIEISTHPVVTHSITETLEENRITDGIVLPTLRRGRPELPAMLAAVAALYCAGGRVDWNALQYDGMLAELPRIAWQHASHWFTPPRRGTSTVHRQHNVDDHVLLGGSSVVNSTTSIEMWHTRLDETTRPYPGRHPVRDVEIVPAAVLLNTFAAIARGGTDAVKPVALTDVTLRTPVTADTPREIQLVRQEGSIHLNSRRIGEDTDESWLTHTTATIAPPPDRPERVLPLGGISVPNGQKLAPGFVIDELASVGVAAMGFHWEVQHLSRGDGALLARVRASMADQPVPTTWASLLDAALSIASVVFPGPQLLRMPAHIREFVVTGPPPADAVIVVRTVPGPDRADTVDVEIATTAGQVLVRMSGLRYGLLDGDPGAHNSPRRLVHQMQWRPFELSDEDTLTTGTIAVVGSARFANAVGRHWPGVEVLAFSSPSELAADRDQLGVCAAVVVAPESSLDNNAATWLLISTANEILSWDIRPPVWTVTRGVRNASTRDSLAHGALWGLSRVLTTEYGDFYRGTVDMTADEIEAGEAKNLLSVIRAGQRDDIIALHDKDISVARLTAVEGEEIRGNVECRPDGTYLITGGLGVLGLRVADWLAGRGARRLILAGRTALPPRREWDHITDPDTLRQVGMLRSLEARGVTVRPVALDIADPLQARRLLNPTEWDMPPVRGIVHAAGVLDNRLARDVDEESLRRVMRPKVDGAMVLHELFPPGSVDFMVLFSSAGLLLGLPGQTTYAAANAYLDALAAHRRSGGHTDTISLGWTSWRGLGMSTSSEIIDAELNARGTGDIKAAEAFDAWDFAWRQGIGYAAVFTTIPPEPGAVRPALLAELAVPEPLDGEQESGEAPWSEFSAHELREYLTDQVRAQVSAEMRLPPADLDLNRPLVELGLDSMMTLVVRQRLQKQLRVSLPSTLLWNRPTVAAVGEYLTELVTAQSETVGASS
ncbi:type I polyketide synthase [Kibdelosporangium aridum]|uniref:Type I polyketide synthase n=2 Tax=Kibdelosporangium aridum TaxID=2030 RepID=A0A428Z0P0_KIBAR|nr:type I polyketide synthase [Kibdelosporangium aridum]